MWITIRLQIKLVQQIPFLQYMDKMFEPSLNTWNISKDNDDYSISFKRSVINCYPCRNTQFLSLWNDLVLQISLTILKPNTIHSLQSALFLTGENPP